MAKKEKRSYRASGLEFSNLAFSSKAEEHYVRTNVDRLAEKIRATRKELNLSQEELAEMTSTSLATIKFIEQKQRAPSLPMLFKILFILDREARLWS